MQGTRQGGWIQAYCLEARDTVGEQLGIIGASKQQSICTRRVQNKHGSHIVSMGPTRVQVQPLLWVAVLCWQVSEAGHLYITITMMVRLARAAGGGRGGGRGEVGEGRAEGRRNGVVGVTSSGTNLSTPHTACRGCVVFKGDCVALDVNLRCDSQQVKRRKQSKMY